MVVLKETELCYASKNNYNKFIFIYLVLILWIVIYFLSNKRFLTGGEPEVKYAVVCVEPALEPALLLWWFLGVGGLELNYVCAHVHTCVHDMYARKAINLGL